MAISAVKSHFRPDIQASIRLFVWALGAGIVAGVVFTVFPEIDRKTAAFFFVAPPDFLFRKLWISTIARDVFQGVFILSCIVAIAGLALAVFSKIRLFQLSAIRWIYFLSCVAIGPGLVANLFLKDQWGRARPYQLDQFGGNLSFSPALQMSDQCASNCSFVSGEAASIFMLFFALALVLEGRRRLFLILAIVMGSLSGFIRMGQGGHFFSDVIFAGVIMAMIASILYLVIIGPSHGSK